MNLSDNDIELIFDIEHTDNIYDIYSQIKEEDYNDYNYFFENIEFKNFYNFLKKFIDLENSIEFLREKNNPLDKEDEDNLELDEYANNFQLTYKKKKDKEQDKEDSNFV